MFVRTDRLRPQWPKLVATGHTDTSDPGITKFNGSDFIKWRLSPKALRDLFSHEAPYSDEEIAVKADKWKTDVGLDHWMMSAIDTTTEELGLMAARKAVSNASFTANEVKQIREVRFATNTGRGYANGGDYIIGQLMAEYQIEPHDWEPRAERVQEACSIGLQGLQDIDQAIRSGAYQSGYGLLVAAEKTSELASWDNWDQINLFSDGSAAVLVKATDQPEQDSFLGYEALSSPSKGQIDFIRQTEDGHFTQKGGEVHLFVLKQVPLRLQAFLEKMQPNPDEIAAGEKPIKVSDLSHLILHQPSGRTLWPLEKRIYRALPDLKAKFHYCFDQTTNLSSATALWELSRARQAGEIEPGHLVLLCAFGAGMSLSIVLLKA